MLIYSHWHVCTFRPLDIKSLHVLPKIFNKTNDSFFFYVLAHVNTRTFLNTIEDIDVGIKIVTKFMLVFHISSFNAITKKMFIFAIQF
jgi:hypothetical protein